MKIQSNQTSGFEVRRAEERFHTKIDWLDSWHSFSFGHHFEADNTGHGLLIVNNDDVIGPGAGFGMHGHRDMEIVTWVLDGELEHRDSKGNHGRIRPGIIQAMSAGNGIRHSEANPDTARPVRLVQMWVLPGKGGIEPGYAEKDVSARLQAGGMSVVASGSGHDGAILIHQPDAVLWAGRLKAGEQAMLPSSPFGHLFICTGEAALADGTTLIQGDAVRFAGAGEVRLIAGAEGAEVLHWEMHSEAEAR